VRPTIHGAKASAPPPATPSNERQAPEKELIPYCPKSSIYLLKVRTERPAVLTGRLNSLSLLNQR
jgi:hypothetical protein